MHCPVLLSVKNSRNRYPDDFTISSCRGNLEGFKDFLLLREFVGTFPADLPAYSQLVNRQGFALCLGAGHGRTTSCMALFQSRLPYSPFFGIANQ
jgi:hypothetical protein